MQSRGRELDLMVLQTLVPAGSETATLARLLARPAEAVERAVARLAHEGLVETHGGAVSLTGTGRLAAARMPGRAGTAASGTVHHVDLSAVVQLLSSRWRHDAQRVAAERTARDTLLASDADRDNAVQQLSTAYAQGRLSSAELEQRTGTALTARTYGDLDIVLQGLGGLHRPARSHPVRRFVFWSAALLFSPFVLMGAMLVGFGSDLDDHVVGAVFLVLTLPSLFALRRWAAPRS